VPSALLVNPGIHDFAAYDLWARPLGLLRVGALLRAWGWHVELLDCLDRGHPRLSGCRGASRGRDDAYGCGKYPREEIASPEPLREFGRRYFRYGFPPELIREEIRRRERPDLILLGSGMTYWYPALREILGILAETRPGVPLVLGGTYARLLPRHAKTLSPGILVQAEAGAAALALTLARLGFPHPVAGDDPSPAFDLLRDRSALPLQLSRGCPFSCPYCAAGLLESPSRRDPAAAAREVLRLRRKLGAGDFAFYDNALLAGAKSLLDPFLERVAGAGLRFHAPNGLHARLLTKRTAGLMAAAGFATVRLSLEASQPARQRLLGGKAGLKDLTRAAGLLAGVGFPRREIGVYTLLGYPGQTPPEVEEDIAAVHGLGLRVLLSAFSPIPGTKIFRLLEAAGLVPEDPVFQNNTVFPTLGGIFTLSEIRRLRELASAANRELPQ